MKENNSVALYPQYDRPITTLSMFTASGMLEAGIELAFGDIFDPVAYVECEAYPVAVLAEAMESGRIRSAPVWSDARSVCGPQFRHYVRQAGGVEAIVAGYPCPDFSCAGKRAGLAGDKGSLWWSVAEAVAEYEPELLFLENVGGHTSKGFDTVCGAIRSMGYRVAAGLFTAAEIGARHGRERLFVLADRDADGRPRRQEPDPRSRSRIGPSRRGDAKRCGSELADAINGRPPAGECGGIPGISRRREDVGLSAEGSDRQLGDAQGDNRRRGVGGTQEGTRPRRFRWRRSAGSIAELADAAAKQRRPGRQIAQGDRSAGQPDSDTDRPGRELADAVGEGLSDAELRRIPGTEERGVGQGPATAELRRARLPLFPPGSGDGDLDDWRKVLEIDPALEPTLCLMADGMADRAHQIRMLGEGVVPLQAAYAFATLGACLWGGEGATDEYPAASKGDLKCESK